jgi:hypothetical protein
LDYRNPEKLISENGYFLTNFQGAIMFWQNLTFESLNISKEEFDEMKSGNLFNSEDFDLIQSEPQKKVFNKLESIGSFDTEVIKVKEDDEVLIPKTPFTTIIENDESVNVELFPLFEEKKVIPVVSSNGEMEDIEIKGESFDSNEIKLTKLRHFVEDFEISHQFQDQNVEDLKIGDLKNLLGDYKRLIEFKENIKNLL